MDASVAQWFDQDARLASFVRCHENVSVFVQKDSGGTVLMAVAGERMQVRIEDEADCSLALEVCRQAVAKGVLKARVDVLIDLSAFIGVIDWGAIADIRALLPWGAGTKNRAAYVFRDRRNALLLKIMAAMFPAVEHQEMENVADACKWLGWI